MNLAYQEATVQGLVYYVAAALSYSQYNDSNTFTLGNGEITVGLNGQVFTNVKLNANKSYYYFVRAYSLNYNEQVMLLFHVCVCDVIMMSFLTCRITL